MVVIGVFGGRRTSADCGCFLVVVDVFMVVVRVLVGYKW